MVTYRNVYRYVCINGLVYTCFLVLSAEKAGSSHLGFHPNKKKKKLWFPEVMADSRTGKEIYEMDLKHLVAPESKEVLKKQTKAP